MRPGGGFRQTFGSFGESHLEENASQAATSQKVLAQQQANSSQPTLAGSAPKSGSPLDSSAGLDGVLPGGMDQLANKSTNSPQQPHPREMGTIPEELITRPVQDIFKEVSYIFNPDRILGINPQTDTPEQQAKKRQTHQRWQRLDQEQQAEARRLFQEKQARKQREEQELQQKKQREAELNSQSLALPSSPKKGPVGPSGSKRQKATQQLQHNRKTLSNLQGSG